MEKYGNVELGQHFTLKLIGRVQENEGDSLIKDGESNIGIGLEFWNDMGWDSVIGEEGELTGESTIAVVFHYEEKVEVALRASLSNGGQLTGNFGCLPNGSQHEGELVGEEGNPLGIVEVTLGSDGRFRSKAPFENKMEVSLVRCQVKGSVENATCDLEAKEI